MILQRISTAHGILCSICDVGLKGRLEAEPEFQKMCKTKRHCAMNLYAMVKKTCNGSTYVVVDDVVGKMLEYLHNVFLIRCNDCITLLKYHEAAQHRFKVLEEAGC